MTLRKKLIEVALPLEAINAASAREKSIRHGHPSTLHLWWARRPLAAARAVIFAQMVDDPSTYVETLLSDASLKRKAERELKERQALWQQRHEAWKAAQAAGDSSIHAPGEPPTLQTCAADLERERLFDIIRELVKWEKTTNEDVLRAAREEIWQSWRRACADNADHPRAAELFRRDVLPAFHDPFAGGGALPLEAQRLGLESHASDLNPVAVLINKAMIEIPPRFAGHAPANPGWRSKSADERAMTTQWRGAQGLADDVRYYGQWMRDEAEKRIGHLYPKVEVTADMVKERPDLKPYLGQKLTVIAWLWARTVKSPNPAFAHVDVPLASTFMLSTKAGKEAYVEPVIEGGTYRFTVKVGKPKNAEAAKSGTKVSRGGNFQCLMSGTPIPVSTIRDQGVSGKMGTRLMGIVAEGGRGRVYLAPTREHEAAARDAQPDWEPDTAINHNPRDIRTQLYGLMTYGNLFTPRQLVALTTFSDLVSEAIARVVADAKAAGFPDDGRPLRDGGSGAAAYGDSIGVYLAFGIDKVANSTCSLVKWNNARDQSNVVFTRQALPMMWDFADVNPFAGAAGDFALSCEGTAKTLAYLPARPTGLVYQQDASTQAISLGKVVSTDPPYYDNIGYADLSDFFYVWLRRSVRSIFPDIFTTMSVPKKEELVATPYRHGGKEAAENFFLRGMTQVMRRLAGQGHPAYPVSIYYAFKQSEEDGDSGTTNTGWDTFLAAVIDAGFAITGTWPVRTERPTGVKVDVNALASSIVLVCRQRIPNTPVATRREFLSALKAELPSALTSLQRGNIAPVDLAQAAIGPGMAIYTRFTKVVDAEGKSVSVRDALALINQTVDETLAEQEGDFDADSRWALAWFEQYGFEEGEFGVANVLAQAKNTGMNGLVEAGILSSARGRVRLLRAEEMSSDWDPASDARLTAWEVVHQLIRTLSSGGEGAAAELMAQLGAKAEVARELCYRLYTLCERKKRANDAMAYNTLVQSWPEIVRLALAGLASADTKNDSMALTQQELI